MIKLDCNAFLCNVMETVLILSIVKLKAMFKQHEKPHALNMDFHPFDDKFKQLCT